MTVLLPVLSVTHRPHRDCARCCSGPALHCYPESMLLLQGLQDHSPAGRLFSAPLLALILGLGAAWTGLMPLSCPAYDLVWSHAIPLATALYLLEADLRGWAPLLLCTDSISCNMAMLAQACSWQSCTEALQGFMSWELCCRLLRSTGTVFVAFCIASAATIIGTLVAWAWVGSQLGQEGWKVWAATVAGCLSGVGSSLQLPVHACLLHWVQGPVACLLWLTYGVCCAAQIAAALCGSYIGGSMNMVAISQAFSLSSGSLFASAMAADNLAMAAYLAGISLIPLSDADKQQLDSKTSDDSAGQQGKIMAPCWCLAASRTLQLVMEHCSPGMQPCALLSKWYLDVTVVHSALSH